MKYRAEIDGLRAVAVIPVILFHAGFDSFSGGFVGVDVFFVISGFLITGILVSELEQGNFSLLRFYERRARRILPALFLVMMVSFPLAWMLLLPGDMKDFTRNLVAVAFFSSNFFFWKETDYWSSDSELNPLLHTWSLAIEEQFYLIFPLLLMVLWRWRPRYLPWVLLVIGIASVLLSQWSTVNAPSANYFLLPTRAWELLLGAVVAMLGRARSGYSVSGFLYHRSTQELLSILGLGLIVVSIFYLDESTPFPGFIALLPTGGTALILLFASGNTVVGRILAQRPLVVAGLLSYSAYLWHQPLLAFARHACVGDLTPLQLFGLIGLTFVLAGLSWYLVERPFRQRSRVSRENLYKSALACMLGCIAIGIAGNKTYGFLNRSGNPDSFLSDSKTRINFGLDAACDGNPFTGARCQTSDQPEILVWGDSYAMHLVQGILASNPSAGILQLTQSSCAPIFDLAPEQRSAPARSCLDFTEQSKTRIQKTPSLRYAVLSSPFASLFRNGATLRWRSGHTEPATVAAVDEAFRDSLAYLVSQGITPVIFSPTPRNGNVNIGQCLRKAEYFGRQLEVCNFELNQLDGDQARVHNWLTDLADSYPVVFLESMICPQGTCRVHSNDQYLYRDQGHLSEDGSRFLGTTFNFYGLVTDRQHYIAEF